MAKRSAFVLVIVLAVTLLIVSCVGPTQDGTGTVSNLEEVSESEPTYGLALIASEDTKELFQSMAELMEFLPDLRLYRQEYSDPLEQFLNLLKSKSNLIESMRKFLAAKDSLLTKSNRHEYCFEITGEAKKQIISSISSVMNCEIEEPQNLWFDFRDVMLLSLVFEPIVTAYDITDELPGLINIVTGYGFNPSEWFTDQAISAYKEFVGLFTSGGELLNILQNIRDLAAELAQVSEPVDILDLRDIFKEGTLTVKNLDKILKTVDDVLKVIVEIYDFERDFVDDDGSCKD